MAVLQEAVCRQGVLGSEIGEADGYPPPAFTGSFECNDDVYAMMVRMQYITPGCIACRGLDSSSICLILKPLRQQ